MNGSRATNVVMVGLVAILTTSSHWRTAHANDEPAAVTWPRPALEASKAAKQRLLDIDKAESIIAVGEQGLILRSEDGSNWRQVSAPVDAMLTRVKFVDDTRGFVLGHDAVILETRDAGQSWSLRHHDSEARALLDVIHLETVHWLAIGAYGAMLESLDDGQTWTPIDNALTDLGMHFNRISRTASGSLFIAGERGLAARSQDNGQTWDVLDFPYAGSLFGAAVIGDQLWVHGMRGRLYVTDSLDQCATTPADTWDPYERQTIEDSEQTAALGWRQVQTPTQESLFGAEPFDKDLLLFGVNGTVLHLAIDSGQVRKVAAPADETLTAGIQLGNTWLAVGRRGITRVTPAP